MNNDKIDPLPTKILASASAHNANSLATWDQIKINNQYDAKSFKEAPPIKSFNMICDAGDVVTVDIEYYGGDPNNPYQTIARRYVVTNLNMTFNGMAFDEEHKEVIKIEEDKYKGEEILEF